ncbi:MAG TPA: response regulator [Thermoanaerobaculia bacterium]
MSIPQLARELGLTPAELQQLEEGTTPMPPRAPLLDALEEIGERLRASRTRDCLIVEDDPGVRELFAKHMRAQGCTVDVAADGFAALDAAAVRDYRMLLLDLRLPKLSGAEVLARVLRKPGARPRVIVISAAGSGDIREIASLRTVQAILRKSFAIANAEVIFPALAAVACEPA